MRQPRNRLLLGILSLVAILTGCSGPRLVPAPNLYHDAGKAPWAGLSPDQQTVTAEILYATDRAPVHNEGEPMGYSHLRSHSLAVGRAIVRFGDEGLTWDELVTASSTPRAQRIPLKVTTIEELIRFPTSVPPLIRSGDELIEDPAVMAEYDAASAAARQELSRRLAATPRKEAFIFVHGVANQFDDAVLRMGQLWHFLGREGVPIVYTWPAGRGGALRGYTYDRESSEFTIFHLRQFLLLLASCPELERVHIIAHSRGTDVIMNALRELQIQLRAKGLDTRRELKLGNVILAAPDIDWAVVQQRLRPDLVYLAPSRVTIYVSDTDKAIGLAQWLFSSATRLGDLRGTALTLGQRKALTSGLGHFAFIDVKTGTKTSHGHGYFTEDPAVLSDIILLLRDDRDPGAASGRPLDREEGGFWEIRRGYPSQTPDAPGRQ